MKSIILLFALCFTLPLLSQEVVLDYDIATGRMSYTKVMEVEGKTAMELYEMCEKWVAYTFKNEDAVTQSNVEGEMIRGQGMDVKRLVIDKFTQKYGDLIFQFQIDIKDGKIRFKIYDIQTNALKYNLEWTEDPLLEEHIYKPDGSERASKKALRYRANIIKSITESVQSLEDFILNKEALDNEWNP